MTISVKTFIKGEFLSAADLNATLTTLVDEINRVAALPPEGQKNYIINGDFSVWQRGTSQTTPGYGADDRWFNGHSGSPKTTSRQAFTLGQTDVPNNPKYYSRTVVTSNIGSTNYVNKYQRIEDVTKLSGEEVTLSFWAKADAAKNIAVEFSQSFGTGVGTTPGVDAIGVTTVALTTSWAKHTVTVTLPSVSGKTLGANGDDHTKVTFWFEAGYVYSSRSNSLGQQSGTFDIANVQLEKGDTATDFEYVDEMTQLARCQRYFERVTIEDNFQTVAAGYAEAATEARFQLDYLVKKRAVPSIRFSSSGHFSTLRTGTDVTSTNMNAVDIGKRSARLVSSTSGHTAGEGCMLAGNTTSAYIDIDAEL